MHINWKEIFKPQQRTYLESPACWVWGDDVAGPGLTVCDNNNIGQQMRDKMKKTVLGEEPSLHVVSLRRLEVDYLASLLVRYQQVGETWDDFLSKEVS